MEMNVQYLVGCFSTFIFFAIISEMYRLTWMYRLAIHLVIGSATANALVQNIYAIRDMVQFKLLGEHIDPTGIVILILGLCYFCIFSVRLRPLFRFVTVLMAGMTFGIGFPYGVTSIVGQVTGYGKLAFTRWEGIIAVICLILGYVYFTFGTATERITRYPRMLGRFVVLKACVFGIASLGISRLNMMTYELLNIARRETLWIPVIMLAAILVDHLWWSRRQVLA